MKKGMGKFSRMLDRVASWSCTTGWASTSPCSRSTTKQPAGSPPGPLMGVAVTVKGTVAVQWDFKRMGAWFRLSPGLRQRSWRTVPSTLSGKPVSCEQMGHESPTRKVSPKILAAARFKKTTCLSWSATSTGSGKSASSGA